MTPAVGVHGAGFAEPFSKPGLPSNCCAAAEVTVTETVVVCVLPPPVPVTVIGNVPVAVVDATVMPMLDVPEPGAAIDDGVKVTVMPAGAPEEVSATAALNPPAMADVIVDEPLVPCLMLTLAGEAESAKSGVAAAVTVRPTFTVCVVVPLVPVTTTV